MKYLALASCLFALPALAQVPPVTADHGAAALGQEIMACVSEKITLRVRVHELEAEIMKMKAEAAKLPEKTP